MDFRSTFNPETFLVFNDASYPDDSIITYKLKYKEHISAVSLELVNGLMVPAPASLEKFESLYNSSRNSMFNLFAVKGDQLFSYGACTFIE